MKMPYGKYKGKQVADITDLNYLEWLKDNWKYRNPPLYRAIDDQIEKLVNNSAQKNKHQSK